MEVEELAGGDLSLDEPLIDAGGDEGGDTGAADVGLEEPEIPGAEGGEGEGAGEGGEGGEPLAAKVGGEGQPLPPDKLVKALRELKAASPDHSPALNELNRAWHRAREFTNVFKNPTEARTAQETIQALGGTDGISKMQKEIDNLRTFDEMAEQGNPKVIESLAQTTPDGFKRLVPVALDTLAKMDASTYGEIMRGPLLRELEGSGLIDNLGVALDELKAGLADKENMSSYVNRAQRVLAQIGSWYEGHKKAETDYRNRYQDPRLQQFETRESKLREGELGLVKTNVVRDVSTYLNTTMQPEVDKVLTGKNLSINGRARFEGLVKQEIVSILKGNAHYNDTLRNLIRQKNVDGAVRFAKPFIDGARRKAITSVYTDMFGSGAPATQQRRAAGDQGANGNRQQQQQRTPVASSGKPVPIGRKPTSAEIDWDKDPGRVLFITGKAYLKGSGKLVTWLPSASR